MPETTPSDKRVLDTVVRLVRELHGADWGDWSLDAVRALVAARPDWTLERVLDFDAVVRPGTDSAGLLVMRTGRHGPGARRYDRADLLLPEAVWKREDDFAALVEALSGIGSPAAHRGRTAHPTLRWRGADRVMVLQRNDTRVWLAVHPSATAGRSVPSAVLRAAAEAAEILHDAESGPPRRADLDALARSRTGLEPLGDGGGDLLRLRLGGVELRVQERTRRDGTVVCDRVRLFAHRPAASPAQRRDAFGELFGAVVGAIGLPTLYGGSADGPDVRWRSERRLLLLRGNDAGAWLETHPAQELEDEEHLAFKWGGAWSASEPPDFAVLPYLWQLDRRGPGDNLNAFPGERIAASMEHLQEALELLLAALTEQLPAQLGRDWAAFTIANRTGRRGELRVSFAPSSGLWVGVDDCGGGSEEATTLRDRGWQKQEGSWWQASFPEPTRASAAEAARLIVAELTARGAKTPADDLAARDISCNDSGWLRLTGLGV